MSMWYWIKIVKYINILMNDTKQFRDMCMEIYIYMHIYVYVHMCIYTHICVYGDREKVHRGRRHRKKNLLTQKVLRHLYINMQKKEERKRLKCISWTVYIKKNSKCIINMNINLTFFKFLKILDKICVLCTCQSMIY